MEARSLLAPALCFPAPTAQSPSGHCPFTHWRETGRANKHFHRRLEVSGAFIILAQICFYMLATAMRPQGLNSLNITCWELVESMFFSYHALSVACNFLPDPVFHLSIFRHLMALNFSGIFPSVTFNSALILGHQLQY